jgi:serine protease AprX
MVELKNYAAKILVEQHSATDIYVGRVLPFISAKISITEIDAIARYDFVELLGDGERTGTWLLDVSIRVIRARDSWDIGFNGSGIRIAILDSGIRQNHPDLPVGTKIVDQVDYTGTGFHDSADHGTHCAGIAAGLGVLDNRFIGVAPGALILNVKVGTTAPVVDYVQRGIDWAVNHGANVISMSLGLGGQDDCAMCTTCRRVEDAIEQGVVVVIAAGNSGPGSKTISCPGCTFNAITVGAMDDNDTLDVADDDICSYSSRGPVGDADSRTKPDVVAPAGDPGNIMSPCNNANYDNFGGTSAAAPHVAGAVALILEAHPDWTPVLVKDALKRTAVDLGYDVNTQGAGRIDVLAAIQSSPDGSLGWEPFDVNSPVKIDWYWWGYIARWMNYEVDKSWAISIRNVNIDEYVQWYFDGDLWSNYPLFYRIATPYVWIDDIQYFMADQYQISV